MTTIYGDVAAALDPVLFAARIGFIAEPWQERLMRSPSKRVLLCCARQTGKTSLTAIRAVHTALFQPGSLILILAPGLRQSEELLRRVRSVYRAAGRPLGTVADSSTTLELDNGSRVVALPSTEGTTRGFADVRLLILDEAARIEDEILAAVLPSVATGGTVAALSTPWGERGWFHGLWTDSTNGWERHRVTVAESAQWSPSRIEEARRTVSSFIFASDYEATFTSTDESLFSAESIRAAFGSTFAPLFPIGDPA